MVFGVINKMILKIRRSGTWQLLIAACALLSGVYALLTILPAVPTTKNYPRTQEIVKITQKTKVNFKIDDESNDHDILLPWWEQRSIGACKKFLIEEVQINTSQVIGNCGYMASNVGEKQKVISYTLFGTNSDYWKYLDDLLNRTKLLYPGWNVRLHTDPRMYQSILCPLLLSHKHFYICDVTNLPAMGDQSYINGYMRRMLPIADSQVEVFIARDLDSMVRTISE